MGILNMRVAHKGVLYLRGLYKFDFVKKRRFVYGGFTTEGFIQGKLLKWGPTHFFGYKCQPVEINSEKKRFF